MISLERSLERRREIVRLHIAKRSLRRENAELNAEIAELKADIDDLKGTIGLKDILIEYFDRKAKLSVREEQ